jgi:hypothetical protein
VAHQTKNPNRRLATSGPVLVNRAECQVCHALVGVADDGVLVSHVAAPAVRARGEYKLCAGTGAEAGRVIHGAIMQARL